MFRDNILIAACSVIAGGCVSDSLTTPSTNAPSRPLGAAPTAPRIVSLETFPASGSAVVLGSTFIFHAFVVRSDSSRAPVAAQTWTSSNEAVLTVNPITGLAAAVGVGTALVGVQAGGFSGTIAVTIIPPTPNASGSTALTVNSFSVIELEYASLPGHWFYAPQVEVTATGTSVTVLTLQFNVPGIGENLVIGCGGAIPTGASRDLNGEVYGDWLFTFDREGALATGPDATATVTFIDSTGTTGTITTHGLIARGTLPTTYSGGKNGGPCFHGYGG
jgi:hypothetical protein